MTSSKNGFDGTVVRAVVIAIACSLCLATLRADEEDARLLVDAKINGKPLKLAFDTGSEASVLFRSSAERLGLKVTNLPGGEVNQVAASLGTAERCNFTVWNLNIKAVFYVLDVPGAAHMDTDIDGVLGWPFLKKNIIQFDALNQKFGFLDGVPKETSGWLKFRVQRNSDLLILEIPSQVGEKEGISVDTGSSYGISLDTKQWREWTATHTNRLKTMEVISELGTGLVAQEEAWAKEMSFGPLILTDVPIAEAPVADIGTVADTRSGSLKYRATFGMAALKRLNFIVDGKKGVAYLQPKQTPAPPYPHNRIGAVFVPANLETGNDLIAHVLDGSPAYEAGIRNGDVLLKVDKQTVTNWHDPNIKIHAPFYRPVGTKIELTLRRVEKEFQTGVMLRNMIGPSVVGSEPKSR